MIVSVLDENNQPVMGLQPDNFLVREDQAVREVLRVSQNPTGRQIALLVDTSAYAEGAVRDFRLGLNTLIGTLYQGNEISLISYGGPPRILVEATGSRSRLEAGVGQIFAFASSAAYLLDAMRETAHGFARRDASPWHAGPRDPVVNVMRRVLPLVVLGVSVAAVATGGQQRQDTDRSPQTPAFRSGVDVVSLNVTATDADGRFVTNLTREAFEVYEDGVHQEVSFFNRKQSPIALALLMDTSASMDKEMTTAQEAAIGFSRRLRPEDLAEIIDFDSRVDILQGFTNDVELLERAIGQTSAGGSTALYNALYISLKELKQAPVSTEELRREAIVVLSDGEDTSSLVTFEEVLELAKRSETAIYTIGLKADDKRRRSRFTEADFVLRQLAQETGGRSFFPKRVEDLSTIYEQISDELSSQYTLGYTSSNPLRNGQWRRIIVRVDLDAVTARTKQGYYASTGN